MKRNSLAGAYRDEPSWANDGHVSTKERANEQQSGG